MYTADDPRNIVPLKPNFLEGQYNARDVLGMARVLPLLLQSVTQTQTQQVYELDLQLARIALQMKRAGMPVDMKERDRVRTVLTGIRDDAEQKLLASIQGERFSQFVDWVTFYQAQSVRKDEPTAGMLDAHGNPMSAEIALSLRQQIRKDEFMASLEKSAVRKAVWEWIKYAAFTKQACTIETLVQSLRIDEADKRLVQGTVRSFITRGFVVEATDGNLRPADAEAIDEDAVADVIGGLNPGAKIQQAAILRTMGVPLTKVTEKTGMPKIDKDVLESNGHHEVARLLLKYTLTASAVANFIDGIIPEDVQPGSDGVAYGVIRVDWMIHKITGRWGSSPNVQNWSKRAGGGVENIRRMIASSPEEILIGADYAQLEARLLAAMSQDPFLLNIFINKLDIHSEFAKLAFPAEYEKLAATHAAHKGQTCGLVLTDPKSKCKECKRRDKLRDLTKRLEYGGFYGGEVETLWASVVKDEPELEIATVRNFLAQVNQTCRGLRLWQRENLERVLKAGEIRSPILGRRQVFPMERVDPTVVSNFPNQSGGADFWGIGAVRFAARYDQTAPVGTGPRLIHNGHDSVLVRAPAAMADEVKKVVEECWFHHWNNVDFPIEAEAARRWSDT